MLPKYRTALYTIWAACERFDIKPPGVKDKWEDCGVLTRARLMAFEQIRDIELQERNNEYVKVIAKVLQGKPG